MPGLYDRLPPPAPDVDNLVQALRNRPTGRIPLFELGVADPVLAAFKGADLAPRPVAGAGDLGAAVGDRLDGWHRLGFDYFLVRADTVFSLPKHAAKGAPGRGWIDEHTGALTSLDRLDDYDWPQKGAIPLHSTEAALERLPEGMGLAAFTGGVLEWATILVGLEPFMLGLYDDPGFIRAVVDRVGLALHHTFAAFCAEERVCCLFLGDDFGYKNGTLIHPDHLRELILPWVAKYARLAHDANKPFVLHSCGCIEPIMADLVAAGVDARHSFEDAITPVEEAKAKWGDRVAILGGVDVDLLSRGTEGEIRARTRELLERCTGTGGYAAGSGNSIPDYVPPASYLALLQEVAAFNAGRGGKG